MEKTSVLALVIAIIVLAAVYLLIVGKEAEMTPGQAFRASSANHDGFSAPKHRHADNMRPPQLS